MHRWILAATIGAGLVLAPGAGATPSTVGQYHDDTGSAVVRGTDGLTYQMTFRLQATAGNPSQAAVATVSYRACTRAGKCGFTYTYSLGLSAGQASFPDANTAVVSAKLLGKPLQLHWTAHPAALGTNFSGSADVPNSVAVGDPTSGGPSAFTATFLGTSCGGNGTMTNSYGVFSSPQSGATTGSSRIPAGFVTKRGHKPGCQSS